MPTQNGQNTSPLERHLTEAHSRAERGEYAAAVEAVREAKSLAPKNVYVLAFEKQAEQLSTLDAARSLTDEQRTDILESIPSIIERALESSLAPGIATGISALKSGGDVTQEKREKAAALEWLKNQYFQHAHEYIRKGEYQHALAEIRRVYIIDPSNSIAMEFEKQFEALDKMKRGDSFRMPPPASAMKPQSSPEEVTPHASPESPSAPADSARTVTEEWSSPQHLKRESHHPSHAPEKRKQEEKGKGLLILLILIGLAVLGAVIYIYYERNAVRKHPITSLPPPAVEQFIGAPAEAAEQNFMVSHDDSSSGTPQVTELAANAPPSPAERGQEKKNPQASKSAPAGENPAGGGISPALEQKKPESSPPLMASQAQPGVKEQAPQPKSEDTAAPAPFVAIEKQARIIRLEKPRFSTQKFLIGVEGQVVIQVRIDPTGKPVQTVTLKSTNDLLIQPAIDAVMASQYAPAEMTTGPVASWLTIPFRFASK